MSTDLQTRQEGGKLSEWAHSPEAHKQIAAAVGSVMDPDQYIVHMMVAFQSPDVRRCSVRSQIVAFMECAALGLLPTLNQVKLIPYKDEIKAMPQWQGLKALMERHPDILEVDAQLVHVKDQFQFSDGVVSHSYDPFASDRAFNSEKDIRGGYCKIIYRNGRPPKFHVVTVAQITKCQRCAQTQNVWRAWYEQMALKTLLRDCYARRAVPVDPLVAERLERAFAIDDINLGNNPNRVAPPDLKPLIPPTATMETLSLDPPEPTEPTEPKEKPAKKGRKPAPSPDPTGAHADVEPPREREPGEDDAPITDEAADVSQWIAELASVDAVGDCQAALQALPESWSVESRKRAADAAEMRMAAIRGNRGEGSNKAGLFEKGSPRPE